MSSYLTSVSDGEVAKPLRLQNYTKKMTLANKSAIFMHFCIFLADFLSPHFYAVGASVRPV